MFFKKKRKVPVSEQLGREAGELTKNQMKMPFTLTEHHEGNNFTPPEGFYSDPYIKGYCISFITTMADVGSAKRGRLWSEIEKQSFMVCAVEELVGKLNVAEFIGGMRKLALAADYKLGHLHANTQIKLMLTPKGINLSDPLFAEAVELSQASELYDIVSAFNKVTFTKYVEEKYIS